jgi:hypothetical protein
VALAVTEHPDTTDELVAAGVRRISHDSLDMHTMMGMAEDNKSDFLLHEFAEQDTQ